jgi:hypothetical protein
MSLVRPCRADEPREIHEIINAAAEAYRGVIRGPMARFLYELAGAGLGDLGGSRLLGL